MMQQNQLGARAQYPTLSASQNSILNGTVRSCPYSPLLKTVIHIQHDIAPLDLLYPFLNSENILELDMQSVVASLEAQPGGSQSSSFNLQPYHSSPRQVHETIPSVILASTGVDPSKCGGFHQVELIVTDSHYSFDFLVTMSSPSSTHVELIEHRRDNRIVLEIEIHPYLGMELPWDCIQIPRTKSVQRSTSLGNKKALNFRLEVHGATTGRIRDTLCERCNEKESRNTSLEPTIVDFKSKTNFIDLKSGKARVTFRFLCLSTHHGISDSEYR
jgi:hypothetical protein